MLTIEQIHRFLTVAEYMSFSKAAESLYISTSALSKSISDIENSLGVQLFFRSHSGISLTEAGQILLTGGSRILTEVTRLEQKVIRVYQDSGSQMTIGSRSIISPRMTGLYRDFSLRYPRDSFRIVNIGYGKIGQGLDRGEIDLGVLNDVELMGEAGDYRTYSLEPCRLVAVVSAFHELANQRAVSYEEVNRYRCICCKSEEDKKRLINRPEIVKYLNSFNFSYSTPNEETMFALIRSGFGIGIMPEPIAQFNCSDLIHLTLTDFKEDMQIILVWKEQNDNPALLHFLSLL